MDSRLDRMLGSILSFLPGKTVGTLFSTLAPSTSFAINSALDKNSCADITSSLSISPIPLVTSYTSDDISRNSLPSASVSLRDNTSGEDESFKGSPIFTPWI